MTELPKSRASYLNPDYHFEDEPDPRPPSPTLEDLDRIVSEITRLAEELKRKEGK